MKRTKFCMFATILTICSVFTMPLVSCSNDSDDNLGQTTVLPVNEETKAELMKMLVGTQVDITPALMGEDAMQVFDLRKDGTFTMLDIYGYDDEEGEVSNEDDEDDYEVFTGHWEMFMDAPNPLEPESEQTVCGIKATFDSDNDAAQSGEEINRTVIYYVDMYEDEEGQHILLFNEYSIDYLMMLNELSADEQPVLAKGDTRSVLLTVGYLVYKLIKHGTDAGKEIVNDAKTIVNVLGVDWGHNLSEKETRDIYERLNGDIKKIREKSQGTTNYKAWMGQIYTKEGKNPRICEMNIPGTHDSYTYYFSTRPLDPVIYKYAQAQLLDIEDQFYAGIRCFDIRFARGTHLTKETNEGLFGVGFEEKLYMAHGWFNAGISTEDGVDILFKLLKEHPSETIIAMFAVEGDEEERDYEMIHELLEKHKSEIVANPTPDMKLSDCAGKLIVMQGWDSDNKYAKHRIGPTISKGAETDGYRPESNIIFFNGDKKTETKLIYQNLYEAQMKELVTDFWPKKQRVVTQCFEAVSKTKGDATNTWGVNQISAFVGGGLHMSYSKCSNVMNPWAVTYVVKHRNEKLGIIWMDFAGSDAKFDGYFPNGSLLPRAMVETNRFQ